MSTNVYEDIFTQVFAHRVAMKLPLPFGWQQEVVEQMCKRAPKGWCVGGPPDPARAPQSRADRKMSFESASKTRASKDLTPVAFDIYEQFRYGVCSGESAGGVRCSQFRGEHGIGLIACGACGCTHLKAWAEETKCPLDKWLTKSLLERVATSLKNDDVNSPALAPAPVPAVKKTRAIKLKPKGKPAVPVVTEI